MRKLLAQQHAQEMRVPDIQVVRYDRDGDRSLTLRHTRRRGRPLTEAAAEVVLHLRRLWGFPVRLETWEDDHRCTPLSLSPHRAQARVMTNTPATMSAMPLISRVVRCSRKRRRETA